MSVWADFYSLVLTAVPGIEPAFADTHIRLAAAEFYEKSKAYIVELTPQATVANQSDYTYLLPANTDMVKVQGVKVNGIDGGTELNYRSPSQRTGIYGLSPSRYRVYPTPAGAGTIDITASIKPGALSTGIPDEYFSAHREAISWGAIARLLGVPKKPWTDLGTAAVYANQFGTAIAEEQLRVLKSYGTARLRSTASYF